MKTVWLLALAGLASSAEAQEPSSKTTGGVRSVRIKEGETVPIKVRIAASEKNILSVVTLPDPVAHIVSAWDRKDLSIEHESNKLFLKLLSETEGHLDVVTRAGAHLRLLVLPVPAPAPFDSNVRVTFASTTPDKDDAPRKRIRSASRALELVKAMRLGEVPNDATVRKGKQDVLFSSQDAEVRLLYVYETARFHGYVLTLLNRNQKHAYHVDVRQFTGKNLVLIGSKDVVVKPGKATRVYIVDFKGDPR